MNDDKILPMYKDNDDIDNTLKNMLALTRYAANKINMINEELGEKLREIESRITTIEEIIHHEV